MIVLSMKPDARQITCDPDCLCFQNPTDPNLIRLLVFATDSLPSHAGKYNSKTKIAWLNIDGFQFAELTEKRMQNLDLQIMVNGTNVVGLDFSPS
jgi:hypothetical protein